MIVRITLLAALCVYGTQAVLNKELKRREAFDSYGPPPRPAAQYGPPAREPHREYGVPQQIPFQEYGPPALKYGPPKLNFINSGGGSGGGSASSGLYEQIKTYFGVPKPYYGPPHRPANNYGPPPQAQYGPPPHLKPQYGPPPPKPAGNYGPPPHRPQPAYGPPPKPVYGPPPKPNYRPSGPPPPQALPLTLPSPVFKPEHQPASSYGPPPSGPIHPPKPAYGPPPALPQNNYGPPPLPLVGANFNRAPETTVIIAGGQSQQSHHSHHSHQVGAPVKNVQIQIDSAGHTHSVSGSQAPFHTACDGWKPIPAPIGTYVEHNNIESQGGYSHVQHGGNFNSLTTQYSSSSGGGGNSIIDGLTDEQLVAIALQTDVPNGGGTTILGPGTAFNNNQNLNSIENEALQLSLGALDDSYTKPPSDSFAPGSVHAQKFNGPIDSYGAPPSGPQAPPQQQNIELPPGFGIQPRKPVSWRPPVPKGLLESIGATVAHLDEFGVKPPQQPPTYIPPAVNEIPSSGPGPIDNQYIPPPPPLPPPQSLSLQQQPPQEIVEQQLPQPAPPQYFSQVNQQAPPRTPQHYQSRPQFSTIQQQQPQFNYLPPLQEPRGRVQNQYVPPPPPLPPPLPVPQPQTQYLPPPQPAPRPAVTHIHIVPHMAPPPNTQYLPPPPLPFPSNTVSSYQQQNSNSFTSSGSASSLNEQFIHTQGLPLQQNVQYNQVHDCGHGPNLIGSNFQVQQQQQQQSQQQFNSAAAGLSHGYNAITQSIPVGEAHTQFIERPNNNYLPPNSGNDHEGYASHQSTVTALPDGTNPQDLPGLDGLNVISAQKSQSIDINRHAQSTQQKYQVELSDRPTQQQAQHDEILSQDLLQSILSAIEEPKGQAQRQYQQLASNHNYGNFHDAQNRSDQSLDNEAEQETSNSEKVEVKSKPETAKNKAVVTKIQPIVPEEVPAV